MKITRGAFLKTCAMALVAARSDARVLLRNPFRVEAATPESFRPHVGEAFSLKLASSSVGLKLAEVAVRPPTRGVEQFSLIFHGPAGEPIADGTHRVSHPALGTFDLTIVAVGIPKQSRRAYQAAFSRVNPSHMKSAPRRG